MDRLVVPRGSIGSVISHSVLDWAKHHGLSASPWHQDEPIWYILREETKHDWLLSKYVQLITCVDDESNGSLRLKATPGARAINENLSRAKVLLHIPDSEEAPILAEDDSSLTALVNDLLEKTWTEAEKLDPWHVDDFVDEDLPS